MRVTSSDISWRDLSCRTAKYFALANVTRHPAAAGLLIMGLFGGIGGGVSRDLLLNEIPSPHQGPYNSYIFVCLAAGLLRLAIYHYAESKEEHFRKRILAFFKSFRLPWFAILGAHKALDHGLGFFGAVLVGLLATTAGGVLIDVFSGVTPEVVRPSEHIVTTAVLAGGIYAGIALIEKQRTGFFPVTLVAVLVSFLFRMFAVRDHCPQIVPMKAPPEGPMAAPPVGRGERF